MKGATCWTRRDVLSTWQLKTRERNKAGAKGEARHSHGDPKGPGAKLTLGKAQTPAWSAFRMPPEATSCF